MPHERLLDKLEAYGIVGSTHNWIKCFLTNRSQQVRVENAVSGSIPVLSGVPQGSVLGPTLFLLFINDLVTGLSSSIKLFADDAKLYRRVDSVADCINLQRDLNTMQDWSLKWQLEFNPAKCSILRMGNSPPAFDYHMHSYDDNSVIHLHANDDERDLGVIISRSLKWESQVNSAAQQANKVLFTIKRTFEELDHVTGCLLYNGLVRPRLEYAATVWNPSLVRDIETLEKIQRRATRLICRPRGLSYPERLMKLNLPSLVHRRRRGDMIEMFKYINGINATSVFPFTYADRRTRGHDLKISVAQSRLKLRHDSFFVRTISHWNKLPAIVVQADSVSSFKSRLDRHWASEATILDYRAPY